MKRTEWWHSCFPNPFVSFKCELYVRPFVSQSLSDCLWYLNDLFTMARPDVWDWGGAGRLCSTGPCMYMDMTFNAFLPIKHFVFNRKQEKRHFQKNLFYTCISWNWRIWFEDEDFIDCCKLHKNECIHARIFCVSYSYGLSKLAGRSQAFRNFY